MRKQFKDSVCDIAKEDEKVVLIFGDISVYLFKDFFELYPDRFFNMGICENTLISVAAGLSSQGFHPFIHSINPFITERSYEQIKLDMCYNQFGGNIVTIGASFDYASLGATHHCYNDLAMLRMLPFTEITQPGSKKELKELIRTQYNNGKTTYFRLSDQSHSLDIDVEFGKGVIIKNNSSSTTIMTAGPILQSVIGACNNLNVNIIYFHTLKPIDKDLITQYKDTKILIIHDAFGLHEAINEVPGLTTHYYGLPFDKFERSYGTVNEIQKNIGLDIPSIKAFVQSNI